MKIKKIECEQFAGIRDKELTFKDGLNLIIGENESGKSTIVDLIFHTLFRSAKIDLRGDKEFIERYFPKKAEGKSGDVIDGDIRFETKNGVFRLKKEWEAGEGSVKLTMPDGDKIKSEEEIQSILSEELGYGMGVYGEIVFASQKRRQNIIEAIMKEISTKKTKTEADLIKEELMGTLTRAVLETGGVSLDKLENEIDNKLIQYGERWDFSADSPEGGVKRGIERKWDCATTKAAVRGEQAVILKSYYDLKETEKLQEKAREVEELVDEIKENLREVSGDKAVAEERRRDFQKFHSVLGQVNQAQESIGMYTHALKEYREVYEEWPGIQKGLDRAKNLQQKLSQARIRDLYNEVLLLYKDYKAGLDKIKKMPAIESDDITRVLNAENASNRAESMLCGLDISANIKQLGDIPIAVRSVATGNPLTIKDGEVDLTEASVISIEGVAEIGLMPKGLDIDSVSSEIEKNKNIIKEIFEKYSVSSIDEMRKKEREYNELKGELKLKQSEIDGLLKGNSWEDLKESFGTVPQDTPQTEVIEDEIDEYCDGNADTYISSLETMENSYKSRFGTIDELGKKIKDTESEIIKNQKLIEKAGDIPDEYKDIEDGDEYLNDLEGEIKELSEDLENIHERLREAEKELGEHSYEEYSEELNILSSDFEEKKAVYRHWLHIKEVFSKLKDSERGNPATDIEEKFREYLAIITEDKINLSSMDESMSVTLSSGKNALTLSTLSEGTRDTISLAFRLSMLEHLFPEGDGLAVFDDPFTDMDPGRVKQACELIQKFAEKNQVIFITCDEKYKNLLDGTVYDADF